MSACDHADQCRHAKSQDTGRASMLEKCLTAFTKALESSSRSDPTLAWICRAHRRAASAESTG